MLPVKRKCRHRTGQGCLSCWETVAAVTYLLNADRAPFIAFPIAVKKLEESSCTPFAGTIKRYVRMNRTANSKYS